MCEGRRDLPLRDADVLTTFSCLCVQVVFELFISQLAGIRDPQGPSYVRYYYLLERLAMVKSFVLMIDLKCDDLVRSLFDVLFSSVSKDHSIRVEVRTSAAPAMTIKRLR